MRRFIIIGVILLSVSLIIIAYNTGTTKNEPKIDLKFDVSDLTDKDFESVGIKGAENATKNDFKNIEFTLDVKQSKKNSNRKISIPDIKKIVYSYDRDRYWYGEGYQQDNSQEMSANYEYKIVFYSKGLENQAIKNIFNSAEVKVSWTTNVGENEERVFKLGDVIQFK